jgi:hypothetical protein
MVSQQNRILAQVDALLKESVDKSKHSGFKLQVGEQITEIFASVVEVDSGGAKTVIGHVNIHFGGTIWPLLKCGVAFLLAHLDPTGLTWDAAGEAIFDAVCDLRTVITKLDPAQRAVCRAIIEVALEKKAGGGKPESSTGDIRAYFEKRKQSVPDHLDRILTKLVKGNVLSKQNDSTSAYYSVKF